MTIIDDDLPPVQEWRQMTDGQLMGALAEADSTVDVSALRLAHMVIERDHPLVAAEIDRYLVDG